MMLSIRTQWLLGALLFLVGALPLLAALPTPLVDWPNHLARVHILGEMLHGQGAFWSRFYEPGSFMVPNAALDVAILGMNAAGLDPQISALVFVLAAYCLFVGGVCALALAWDAFDLTKIAFAALLFTTGTLYYGLVNYVLAVGLALCLLAVWVALPGRPWLRTGVAVLGMGVLFFCHLIAAVVFVALLGCVEFASLLSSRRARMAGLGTLAAFAVLLLLRHLSPVGREAVTDMVYMGGGSWQGWVWWKLQLLVRPLCGGGWLADGLALTALLLAGALGLFAARVRLRLAGLLCVVALALMVLAAPERIGTGSLLDFRLALLPVLLAVCGAQLHWRNARSAAAGLGAMALLLALHSAALGRAWYAAGVQYRDFAALTETLEPGSIMLIGTAKPLASITWYDHWMPPIGSIETLAVRRSIFVPMIFANPAQQPLAIRAAFVDLIQPVDLSSPESRAAAQIRLQALCPAADPARRFTRVYVTTFYPRDAVRRILPPDALLADRRHFMLLDGCALAAPPPASPVIADPSRRSPAEAG